jgi:hypothetical protein
MKRRLLQFIVVVLISVTVMELASPLAYYVIHGKAFSRSEITRRLDSAAVVDGPVGPNMRDPLYVSNKVLHPYLGFVFSSDQTGVNRYGFYGKAPPDERAGDRVVIGITGGSVALHFAREKADRLAALLREEHGLFADREVEIVCLAVDGYKQPQQLMVLANLLAFGSRLDILLNIDGFNEIVIPYYENYPEGVYPFYPRLWNLYTSKVYNREVARRIAEMDAIRESRAWWKRLISRSPFRHSMACLTIWESLENQKLSLYSMVDAEFRKELAGASRNSNRLGPAVSYRNPMECVAECVEMWKECSIQMSKLCAANDIFYAHFLQPNQYYQGSKNMSQREKDIAIFKGKALFKILAGNGYPMLVREGAALRECGVRFKDLTMIFEHEERIVYADYSCHFNSLGNDIIAEEVAGFISGTYGR